MPDVVDDFLSDEQLKEAYEAFAKNFVCDKKPEDNVPDRIEQNDAFSFHSVNGWSLVGHGKITNPENTKKQCGRYYGRKGCLHVEKHKGIVTLDGHDHTGEVYVRKQFRWCDNPRCPICYLHGWAVREARRMTARIKEAERRCGEKAEHIISSVPSSDYGLSFEQLKAKLRKVLAARNIHGAGIIFHAFRYHHENETYEGEPPHWFWSPHFHLLGFIRKGYSQCRKCNNLCGIGRVRYTDRCLKCNGFEGVTRRCNLGTEKRKGDGWIVKVAGERRSLFWTAWYQLNHASVKVDDSRFHLVSWFGTVSYTKMKFFDVARENLATCPLCCEDLVRVDFVGKDGTNPLDVIGVKSVWDNYLDERGMPRWIENT